MNPWITPTTVMVDVTAITIPSTVEQRPQPMGPQLLERALDVGEDDHGRACALLVALDSAVANPDDPEAARGDVGLVGDDHDGLAVAMEVAEEFEDLVARLAVEVAGGLIGQQQRRLLDQGPSDRHPLPLAAGHLVGAVPHPVGQPDTCQRLGRAAAPFERRDARVDQRQLDVPQGRLAGQELEGLEHEADLAAPHPRQLGLGQRRHVASVEPVASRRSGRRGSRRCSSGWTCPSPKAP